MVGPDFYGRAEELDQLLSHLRSKHDVLILSPRRVGKSSICQEAGRQLGDDGWLVAVTDAQGCTDESGLFRELTGQIQALKLPKKLRKPVATRALKLKEGLRGVKFGVAGTSVEVTGDNPAQSWAVACQEMEDLLGLLATHGAEILLILDELPILFSALMRTDPDEGAERCRRLLNWLRKVQKQHADSLVWLLCGSIGLDSQVSYLGIPGVLSDFELQGLGPMVGTEPSGLVWELAGGASPLAVTQPVVGRLLERVGWPIPCYIQLLYSALYHLPSAQQSSDYPSEEDVDSAYDILVSRQYAVKFEPWDTRLEEGFLDPMEAQIARRLLNRLCLVPLGIEKADLLELSHAQMPNLERDNFEKKFRGALNLLIHDGYLSEEGQRCAFLSPILRDYWTRKHTP